MDTQPKNVPHGTRLTTRQREIVRAYVLEGKPATELAEEYGLSRKHIARILKAPQGQQCADELLAEHARRIRGKVASLADRAAAVIHEHLADGAEVADYVRSADAKFVLEKIAFPLDLAPLADAIKDPLSELCAWLAKGVAPAPADPLSSPRPPTSQPPLGVNGQARATNGTGYGSSRG